MSSALISPALQAAYDEQYSSNLSAWRELGGKYKARNIVEVCAGLDLHTVLEVGAGEGSILLYLDRWNFCGELSAVEI